jgi:hypothetical protein
MLIIKLKLADKKTYYKIKFLKTFWTTVLKFQILIQQINSLIEIQMISYYYCRKKRYNFKKSNKVNRTAQLSK